MSSPADRRRAERARKRMLYFLERVTQCGVSQAELARRVGLPPQVVSDVRHGRRKISELLARRLGEAFDVDYRWLLGREGDARQPPLLGGIGTFRSNTTLPVLNQPFHGEPTEAPGWDGSRVAIDGAAVGRLQGAERPYVLRYARSDVEGRLYRGDLVLVSQVANRNAEISVIAHRGRLYLARRRSDGYWYRAANGHKLPSDCKMCGYCVGIIWSPLR